MLTPLFERKRLFDALNALALLDEARSDMTLTELALARKRASREPGGPEKPAPATVRTLFERYLAHYSPEQETTRKNVRRTFVLLCRTLGPAMPVEAMRVEDVLGALARYENPRTYNGHVRNLVAALRWGVREGLLARSIAGSLSCKPEIFKEPHFFPPDKVERILRIAEAHPGDYRAAVGMRLSLGFFAGVRSEEMMRTDWDEVNLDEGVVRILKPKGYTNGMKPRIVELEPNAVAWMKKWRGWTVGQRRGHGVRGPIVVHRSAFGDWKAEHLAPLGLSWTRDASQNVMRHTYATMHVGAFRDAAATALNMGHGRSTLMLEQHYRGLVPKATAETYWKILPAGDRG